MKNILLVGAPNAGKSTLFNALTGGHAKVGNWHGVTVGALEKQTVLGGERVTVCDLPGIYSLDSMSMEEGYTRDYLKAHGQDAVLFVAECDALTRSLPLFLKLLQNGRKAALALTKRKRFERAGGKIDVGQLQKGLGIVVFYAEGNGKQLKDKVAAALNGQTKKPSSTAEALEAAVTPPRAELSKTDRLLLNGWVGIPVFFCLLLGVFYLTFAPNLLGDFLKGAIERLFCDVLTAQAEKIASPVLRSFVVDGLLNSLGGVLCFLPQISLLYLALILMEESGFLSRLAYLTDGAFEKAGLNGRAVFSLLMGFGCTAAAILTTRGLDDKKIQRRVILALPYISCSAKLPVYLALSASFFSNPFFAVVLLYALGVGLSLIVAVFLKDKEAPPFIMELAPLQFPEPKFVLKSLLFQIKQFIIKVATVILAFFLASWLFSSFDFSFRLCAVEESMLATVCGWLRFLFAPIGCNDWRVAYAALSGLIAKENVAGVLALYFGGFPFSAASAFAFACFILACSPCVSAIAATAKEVGAKRAALYALWQTGSALLFSYAVYFALCGGAVYLALAAVPATGYLILRKHHGKDVDGKRKNFAKKFHG